MPKSSNLMRRECRTWNYSKKGQCIVWIGATVSMSSKVVTIFSVASISRTKRQTRHLTIRLRQRLAWLATWTKSLQRWQQRVAVSKSRTLWPWSVTSRPESIRRRSLRATYRWSLRVMSRQTLPKVNLPAIGSSLPMPTLIRQLLKPQMPLQYQSNIHNLNRLSTRYSRATHLSSLQVCSKIICRHKRCTQIQSSEAMPKLVHQCIRSQSKSSLSLRISWRHISLPRRNSHLMSAAPQNCIAYARKWRLRACVRCSWSASSLKCSTTSSRTPLILLPHIRFTLKKAWAVLMKNLYLLHLRWQLQQHFRCYSLPTKKTADLTPVQTVWRMFLELHLTQTIINCTLKPSSRLAAIQTSYKKQYKNPKIALRTSLQAQK